MRLQQIFSLLGPGIVWAATSIGVSHIVQSTRAGAEYGFALVGVILLAHIIKYPFFLFGPKYTGLTGKSLLDGYKSLGDVAFYLFMGLTLVTMFFVLAGVTIITSAMAMYLFDGGLSLSAWSAVVLLVVISILLLGHYKALNSLLKWMMLSLAICSVVAWLAVFGKIGVTSMETMPVVDLSAAATIAFIVALIGWMPTSIEVSVWHSLWTLSRLDSDNQTPSSHFAKNACLDFNIGYVTSLVLALIFMSLGASLMFGYGTGFAHSAAAFSAQLIGIYTAALGDWSWLLMAIITFVALCSTTFAVADGFPQVWKRAYYLVSRQATETKANRVYAVVLLIMALGSWWIIADFSSGIKRLLDFVTTVSFVSAPIYGWLNYRVIQSADIEDKDKPRGSFKIYTLISLALLTMFSVFYLWWRFIA